MLFPSFILLPAEIKTGYSGLVHTNEFLFENAYISIPSIHTNMLSTFLDNSSIWKRSWRWIKTRTRTYRICVDGWKRIKMKMMTETITGECDCSMHIKFSLHHSIQFYHFQMFLSGQSKTYQISCVDKIQLMCLPWQQKCMLLKMHLCVQGLIGESRKLSIHLLFSWSTSSIGKKMDNSLWKMLNTSLTLW